MLRVVVESASKLPKSSFRTPDPITTVNFKDEKKKTKSINSNLNPVWNEVLEFDLKGLPLDSSSFITVTVKDFETVGKDKFIGSTTISLKDLASGQVKTLPSKNLPLLNEKSQPMGGTIDLLIAYEPPASAALPNPNDPTANPQDAGGTAGGGDEGDEEYVDGGGGGGVPESPSAGQPGNQLQKRLGRSKKNRRILSNKPQDFQIRIRVIEGRQLPGNNIKPVVKVNVCGQTHRTRIRKGNNPFFDEIFFYNVNMLPSDLFDEYISIRVYDSYSLRADSLMGEFKLDVGYVYDEPGHTIMRKWLLLNDPDDSTSGAKGYLKVSMFIVGTGDELPVENRDTDGDQDDIESNLLLPAGVSLRWVTFMLKLYRAEDIPQMDDAFVQSVKEMFGAESNRKNLVDPFVEVCFAGKKICSKIIEKNANPDWNQVINLQIKFPSMCDRIRLTVFDWDRLTRNDAVGTTYLNLSKIASSGGDFEDSSSGYGASPASEAENTGESDVGFLPAFGPCYVNLYGSPREFTGFPDPYEDLNFGKGEGVAYRGRVLVELTTKLDGKVDKKIEDIPNDDILVVEKYQRRRKYSMCAVFHTANMLQDVGEPIQFEVSIGNYGNIFDSTCKPLASTTQYSCAVFDGNFYYYLPWSNIKPVVILTSYWEDISHRMDAVNIIQNMTDRLQNHISSLKTALLAKVSDTRLAEIWLKLVNQVIEDLDSNPVPELEGKANLTSLDIQIRKMRVSALKFIKDSAVRMREEATDVKTTLMEIENWLERMTGLGDEPQNSMPDVIIWMLRGEKRVAYARIPAHQIMFSTTSEQACGKYCGKTQTIFMQYPMDKTKGIKLPVQLRVNMWFGLSAHENKFNSFAEGTFSVFTEMYENQALVFGKWGTTGLVGRHKTSDITGKIKLKRESFMPPKGWEWEEDWFVDPERSLLTEADAGHTEFTDEVFQNETRYPGGEWKPAEEPYTDVNGEKAQSPSQIECPPGWKWEEAWSFDINRAVDENGWEYGITIPPDSKPKSWVPAEKMYHIHRRKRMVRPRKKESKATTPSEKMTAPLGDPEGWEYSSLIGWKFHRMHRTTDTFRRRRWRKKMAPSGRLGACAIFKLEGALGTDISDVDEKGKSKDSATSMFGANTPTVSCNFDRPFVYHLRVYVYQARNLLALDKDSFSDPYAHVSFLHLSKTTETIPATLNPTWDQTLIFNTVEIYGDPQAVAQNPPNVVFELFDKDQVGKDEPLGRSVCPPLVKLNPETGVSPRLLWYPIMHGDKKSGDLLVAAELIMKDKPDGSNLPIVPPKRAAKLYMVPQGIRPVVQLTGIEILTWGLRNMKNFQLAAVSSPSLIVEFGGEIVQSAVIKNIRKNPNFPGSVLFFKVLLPKEEMYTPPIVIKVIDHRPFGRKPIVGQCTIDSLEVFRCDPYTTRAEVAMSSKVALMAAPRDVAIDMEDRRPLLETQQAEREKETVDWWSKFYSSLGEHEKCGPYLQKGYDTFKIFRSELEDVPEYKGLTDFCDTFKLYRGKSGEDDEDPSVVGEFKGLFKIYPLSDDPSVPAPPRQFRELPDSGPQECIVRIYIIRAIDLQPKDNNGLCDPYIKIALGKKVVEDRDHYIPNTVNPVFGRMFELTCFIPQEKDLKISVYDYDLMSRDEKVGETVIDLENRLLSRFGSYCGIPQTYCISGINQWRDQMKPSQILQNLSRLRGIPPPVPAENGKTLSHAGRDYTLDEFEANKEIHQHLGPPNERLALHVLRTQGLVPEHVESRTLYSSFQPTLSQGILQMWVDIFPKSLGLPGPPFDITPRKPKKFFLRVIIWNTTEVILDETSITGEDMSDIYVKGWMPGMEENKQKTDVHFRSLDGDGNFNWRFVYPFEYLPAEQLCLVSRKEHFWSLDKSEFRTPAKLIIQIWDNDKFSLDDYLGTLELDLNKLTPPAKTPQKCLLERLTDIKGPASHKSSQDTSLFTQKSVRGWWPCMSEVDGKRTLTGKVEMTLEIVTEKEAEERPAGKGRDEPNMNPKLDPPNRPETSFFWFTNPCKTMKFIVWRRFKWVFIGIIILILVLLFLGILFYSLPNYISMKIVNPFSKS
ncbi:myoferlin isoform X3 [Acipenser oxyrinchus oxyrinchus]|uniref:Myoferlin isoform X3 n=1 Tax=Acipenser oxyrinchus oxyrinchus TaxID=40147 RepID=A0AAD8DBU4_ACIOX|nr:myoferlin isoform X3 [Acipenser oxyrinchus oxyrinchus]